MEYQTWHNIPCSKCSAIHLSFYNILFFTFSMNRALLQGTVDFPQILWMIHSSMRLANEENKSCSWFGCAMADLSRCFCSLNFLHFPQKNCAWWWRETRSKSRAYWNQFSMTMTLCNQHLFDNDTKHLAVYNLLINCFWIQLHFNMQVNALK